MQTPSHFLLTAVLVIIIWDWRFALLALVVQYFFAGLLFVDLLDPRLAVVKLLAGWFACLILYVTARQVNWGGRPQDVTAEELSSVAPEKTFQVGPLHIPVSLPLRLLLVLIMLWLITSLFQRPDFALPAIASTMSYLSLDLSAPMLIVLAAVNLGVALLIAYLVQMRHAIPALVD